MCKAWMYRILGWLHGSNWQTGQTEQLQFWLGDSYGSYWNSTRTIRDVTFSQRSDWCDAVWVAADVSIDRSSLLHPNYIPDRPHGALLDVWRWQWRLGPSILPQFILKYGYLLRTLITLRPSSEPPCSLTVFPTQPVRITTTLRPRHPHHTHTRTHARTPIKYNLPSQTGNPLANTQSPLQT